MIQISSAIKQDSTLSRVMNQFLDQSLANGLSSHRQMIRKDSEFSSFYQGSQASACNVFSLPHSILDSSKTETKDQKTKKQARRQAKFSQQKQLGEVGKLYENNLRKTTFNQTKYLFKVRRQRSFEEQARNHRTLELGSLQEKRKIDFMSTLTTRRATSTLRILEKYIISDIESMRQEKKHFEVETTRLPIIRKEWKRERVVPNYDPKYRWVPQLQAVQGDQGYHLRQRNRAVERPEISGWQNQDHSQL